MGGIPSLGFDVEGPQAGGEPGRGRAGPPDLPALPRPRLGPPADPGAERPGPPDQVLDDAGRHLPRGPAVRQGHAVQDPAQPHLPRRGRAQGQELPGRARADRRPRDLGSGPRGPGLEREAPGQRGARPDAGAAQGPDALHALQLGDDADPHAPARPAVPLLRLPRGEPQGPRHLPGALDRRQRGRGPGARAGPAAARVARAGRADDHRGAPGERRG